VLEVLLEQLILEVSVMADFKPGDVVRVRPIKGPWMVVESCEGRSAVCFWFDKNDTWRKETFISELLEQRKSETSGISGFTRRNED
jgi:uncharacterized protein YodC (DUF2158 family)